MSTKITPAAPSPAVSGPNTPDSLEIRPVAAESLPKAADTVKVRFKRGHPRLAYSINEEADLPQALYDEHVGEGEYFEKI